jgi:hypothetical protein
MQEERRMEMAELEAEEEERDECEETGSWTAANGHMRARTHGGDGFYSGQYPSGTWYTTVSSARVFVFSACARSHSHTDTLTTHTLMCLMRLYMTVSHVSIRYPAHSQ